MQKIKSISLFVAFLVLVSTFCCSVIFVEAKDNGKINGEEHRNNISTVVQNLLNAADNEQGEIGDQIRVMAQQQNQSKDDIANTIDKVNARNGLKIFLIGLDYKNIGQLRSEIANTDNRIDRLNTLLGKLENSQDITTIQDQIKTLEENRQKINDIVKANESKFSLFGWFVKLFNK
ncbi:MAG: hypothetical protein WC428_07225 [Candidatus Paceibacterota bacterium]|jgi:microsomal dipeptidase-like Zn-dependent dipeptidase